MEHESRMAPLRAVLRGQPRNVAIEAVYQIGIVLSHRFTWERFLARTKAETKLPYQHEAIDRVLEMLTALERAEGAPITALPAEIRNSYLVKLGDLIPPDESPALISEADIEAALKELREAV